VSKAIIQLLRSIQDCDSVRVASILTEFGNQIPIDTTDKSGRTLLMLACQQGDLEIVKVLVQHGANTSSATLAGKTPVSIAISAGHFPVIQFLLDNDPSLIQSTDTSGTTLLMLAAETAGICFKKGYSTSIIDYLIKKGLDINAQDKHGHTALDRLMMTSGHYEAAQVLIKNGAKIIDKVEKKHGMTTLMMAALNGHTEVVKLLMHQYQQDPRVVNEVFLIHVAWAICNCVG
jgi:ankyrin repeat protein